MQNSLKNIKNIGDAVFNLKFQTKRSTTLLKRDSGISISIRKIYFVERRQTVTFQTSSKNDNSSTGKVLSTDEEILRKKKTNMVSNRPELNV